MREQREKNPIKYFYLKLKHRAQRRGKAFDLTLAQFESFSMATGYFEGHGSKKLSLTIDRIDPTLGYTVDNISCKTNQENGRKGATSDKAQIAKAKIQTVLDSGRGPVNANPTATVETAQHMESPEGLPEPVSGKTDSL